MYSLIEAIKGIIDERVVSRRHLREPADVGATSIHVRKAVHYSPCDSIAIVEGDCLELHTVARIGDGLTVHLDEPLGRPFTSAATIEKVYQGQRVETYMGDPPAIPRLPAITVDLTERDSAPLAIQTVEQTFTVPIGVYVSQADYAQSYALLHRLTERVERMLYTVPYPLLSPYVYSFLTQDLVPYSSTLWVEHPDEFGEQTDIILDSDSSQTHHRIARANNDGSFELVTETMTGYPAGSRIIRPLIKTYGPEVIRIAYGEKREGDTIMKSSILTYTCRAARLRGVR